jgi:putative membrane protein
LKKNAFFTDEEMVRIKAEVARAESLTSGEIAAITVDQSDSYREAEILGAVLLSGFFSLVFSVATAHHTIWAYIPAVFLLYFPALLLMRRFPRLKLPFAGSRRIAEAVRDRALRAFYEKGLYRTREETGVLIFISLLEHKVWILGDRGINARIEPESWQRYALELSTGIKEGRACEALCSVISECGQELSRHFPRSRDDRNELSDDLLHL